MDHCTRSFYFRSRLGFSALLDRNCISILCNNYNESSLDLCSDHQFCSSQRENLDFETDLFASYDSTSFRPVLMKTGSDGSCVGAIPLSDNLTVTDSVYLHKQRAVCCSSEKTVASGVDGYETQFLCGSEVCHGVLDKEVSDFFRV